MTNLHFGLVAGNQKQTKTSAALPFAAVEKTRRYWKPAVWAL
jgi:hypothetical protein